MKAKLLILFLCAGAVFGKGKYTGKYLYAETNPKDTGGIVVQLPSTPPNIRRAVAFAHRQEKSYLGKYDAAKHLIRFPNLPIDKYDLLIITDDTICEGIKLINENRDELVAAESKKIEAEILKVEAFFEGKKVEQVHVSDELKAVALVQQWRIGRALAESGKALKGTIHSVDLFWFEKPAKVWQLVKRRQLYREEFKRKTAFNYCRLPGLSGIRVVRKIKTVNIKLPPAVSAKSQK